MSQVTKQQWIPISEKAYQDLEEAVGAENASREPGVLEGYTWQPTINDDPAKWTKRPVAVVLPGSTEEVQDVIRACNKHGLKFKAFSTGWGIYSACTYDNVVQVDLRRMNRILEVDEKNMYVTLEPYVSGSQLQAELMKLGLNCHIIGAGPACSPLASATSAFGVGWDSTFMSYGHRNLLGAEMVLPDGEVWQIGCNDDGEGWFTPDGPGPGLRGLVRGSTGALSGLGIFTKCTLKLYNWPGPPQMKTEGVMLDSQTEPPEHMRFHLCFFPDKASVTEAVYKMGEAEIAYIFARTAVGAYINTFAPHLLHKIAKTKALKSILSETVKWGCTIVLIGSSKREIEFQEGVLKEIIKEYGGVSIEAMEAPTIGPMMVMNFLRVSAIPMVFRAGGLFSTALPRNEAWDTQMDWADKGEDIKRPWIDNNQLIDDLADNPFMVLYENNCWGHCEEIFQYKANDPKHLEALEPLFFEFSVAAMEMCMEPLSACDSRLREIVSPMMGHYNMWQKKISNALDPERAADTGMYCDEIDFDLSKIDPKELLKLEKLQKDFTWTEEGPPA
jgi:glycolate dehydrogenase FAD-linked subunit